MPEILMGGGNTQGPWENGHPYTASHFPFPHSQCACPQPLAKDKKRQNLCQAVSHPTPVSPFLSMFFLYHHQHWWPRVTGAHSPYWGHFRVWCPGPAEEVLRRGFGTIMRCWKILKAFHLYLFIFLKQTPPSTPKQKKTKQNPLTHPSQTILSRGNVSADSNEQWQNPMIPKWFKPDALKADILSWNSHGSPSGLIWGHSFFFSLFVWWQRRWDSF